MADALPTNKEVPEFDTYPARSGLEDKFASPRSRTYMPGTSGSTAAVPGYNDLAGRSALEERAAQVGGAVGRAVATVRRGRGKLVVMKSRTRDAVSSRNLASKADELKSSARELANTAQQRASELAQDAQERLSGLADQARTRTSEWTQVAREKTLEFRERAMENYHGVRLNLQGYINQNPLQALAIIGGTAAVLGATLRVVRSRNAERM
jgi:hypothetical protein